MGWGFVRGCGLEKKIRYRWTDYEHVRGKVERDGHSGAVDRIDRSYGRRRANQIDRSTTPHTHTHTHTKNNNNNNKNNNAKTNNKHGRLLEPDDQPRFFRALMQCAHATDYGGAPAGGPREMAVAARVRVCVGRCGCVVALVVVVLLLVCVDGCGLVGTRRGKRLEGAPGLPNKNRDEHACRRLTRPKSHSLESMHAISLTRTNPSTIIPHDSASRGTGHPPRA
jgi:hypothetical protein